MPRSIYIDCEWYIGGDIFLIGYAYSARSHGQLYDGTLTQSRFMRLLEGVSYIYFYGPDVGVIEKQWGIRLRDKYICINILKVFRHHFHARSYKLAHIEVMFGIYRSEVEYKKSVWMIWLDWKNPQRKARLLKYNREDVINMMRLWIRVRNHFGIEKEYLLQEKLK